MVPPWVRRWVHDSSVPRWASSKALGVRLRSVAFPGNGCEPNVIAGGCREEHESPVASLGPSRDCRVAPLGPSRDCSVTRPADRLRFAFLEPASTSLALRLVPRWVIMLTGVRACTILGLGGFRGNLARFSLQPIPQLLGE